MRLLLNLIITLSDEEAARLSALWLEGKQEAVLNLAFSKRATGESPTPEEIAALEVSDSHLYEISSVVLHKCHKQLVPEGGIRLLEFLTLKDLNVQFRQELRLQEKKLKNKKGFEAEDFFFAAFELLHRFSFNLVDKELIKIYGKKYLAAKRNVSKEDELAVKARTMVTELIAILANGKNVPKEQRQLLEKYSELEKITKDSSNAYFCHNVYSGLAWYWQYLGSDSDKTLTYLQCAIPYAKRLREEQAPLFSDLPVLMELRVADLYFSVGRIVEASQIFEKIFSKLQPNDRLWRQYHYIFRYLDLLIYTDKFSRAEQILQEYFEPLFKQRATTTSATAATLFALLYLISGSYSKAKKYLDLSLDLNSKTNFTLYNEVRNRYLEAAYYYLTDDWNYTLSLTHRALQYLRGKNIGLNRHLFGYNFKIIEATIEYYSKGTPFWHKFEDKYNLLIKPKEGLIGKLLQKIRSTPKKK